MKTKLILRLAQAFVCVVAVAGILILAGNAGVSVTHAEHAAHVSPDMLADLLWIAAAVICFAVMSRGGAE